MHGLRACIENHWFDDDFVGLMVDMRNAFNLATHQSLLPDVDRSCFDGPVAVITSIPSCGTIRSPVFGARGSSD